MQNRKSHQRLYRVNTRQLKLNLDEVAHFERFWNGSFDRLDEILQELEKKEK